MVAARRKLAQAFSAVLVWVAASAIVFCFLEDWDFFQALYFVLITVTTVGYGDEGISVAGRWVAIAVMLGGIGGTTYSFALMVQVVLAHGSDWRWRMERRIGGLRGHSVVVGYGNMGRALAGELREAGRTVVVVEKHESKVEQAREAGFFAIQGDATDETVLEAAGVRHAREVASCLDVPASNVAVVLSSRDLSAEAFIVGRISSPAEERRMRLAGANEVVSPLHAGAVDAARLLVRPSVTELATNHLQVGLDLGVGEVQVQPGSTLDGVHLGGLSGDVPTVTFVVLVRVGEQALMRPAPSATLQAWDSVVVVGPSDQVQWLSDAAQAKRDVA